MYPNLNLNYKLHVIHPEETHALSCFSPPIISIYFILYVIHMSLTKIWVSIHKNRKTMAKLFSIHLTGRFR